MRKSELFAQILECVAFETEIAKEQILSKDKFQDVVDARYMLVHFCHKNGMYTTDIARMMRFSRRAIEKMVAGFDERKRYSHPIFEIQCELIEEVASHLRPNELICLPPAATFAMLQQVNARP